jgi:AAA domain
MAILLDAAGPASIRTLGDPEQAHAELTTVVRQRDQHDREVCRAIRDGHAPTALADLQARGRLHLAPDRSCAVKELVYAWDRHRAANGLAGVAIVTDTDNATVDTLNALCQARRLAAGELIGPSVTVVDSVTGRRERLYEGDRVRFVRPYRTRDLVPVYVANGTGGHVLAVDLTVGWSPSPATTGAPSACDPPCTRRRSRCGWATPATPSSSRAARRRWCWCCLAAGRPRGSRPTRWPPAVSRSCTSTWTRRRSRPAPTATPTPSRRSASAGPATPQSAPPPPTSIAPRSSTSSLTATSRRAVEGR